MGAKKPKLNIVVLKDWGVVYLDDSPYLAPEVKLRCLVGTIVMSARSCFKSGDPVRTNGIDKVEGRLVTTLSGSQYWLRGAPSANYLAWLASQGIKYDPRRPVRVIDASSESSKRKRRAR